MYRYIWKIKLDDPSKEQAFIDFWQETSRILQTYPGAKGTHMHRVRGEVGSFFAVAEWESQAARDAMSEDIHNVNSEAAVAWRKFPKNKEFGEITQFAGEETDMVLPKND